METSRNTFLPLLLVLTFSFITITAESQNKKPQQKVSRGFHRGTFDDNKMGTTCIRTDQGKRCFTTCFDKSWCGGDSKYIGFNRKNANSIGAEYIKYAGEGEGSSAHTIIFTGKVKPTESCPN